MVGDYLFSNGCALGFPGFLVSMRIGTMKPHGRWFKDFVRVRPFRVMLWIEPVYIYTY